jgi:pyruvate,orthophosphate dikinase
MREMIMADSLEGRQKALEKILPMQRSDYYNIFKEMKDLPVMIRLLDPPLNEFLPHSDKELEELAGLMNIPLSKVRGIVDHLHETNPMLGHRGCRLGLTFPEIYDMQVQAIIEAACDLTKNEGFTVVPEIMMPLVATYNEMHLLREAAVKVADKIIQQYGVKLEYSIGACVELPRTCILADQIAKEAEFFSFGTNDLTQTTYGLSRDDSGDFLPFYVNHEIYHHDPFVSIDQEGVGELVKMACEKARKTRPDIKIGICGEHGGEPESIAFCDKVGLNYVSCSPYRVPVARLASAHAALRKD